MKKLLGGSILVALCVGGGFVEGAGLPRARSLLFDREPNLAFHGYVGRESKYSSAEWGQDVRRTLRPLPVHFHGYVKGRIGF